MDFNGEYFDPYSQKSLENSLQKMWSNLKLRQNYSKSALLHAQNFSWKYTVLQTLALYQQIELNEKK